MRLFPARFTSSSIQKLLDYYSQYNPTPMSIKQFIDFGKLCRTTNFFFLKHAMVSGHIGKCYVPWNIIGYDRNVHTLMWISLVKGECPPKIGILEIIIVSRYFWWVGHNVNKISCRSTEGAVYSIIIVDMKNVIEVELSCVFVVCKINKKKTSASLEIPICRWRNYNCWKLVPKNAEKWYC